MNREIIGAEVARCLQAQVGTLTDAQLRALLDAVRGITGGSDESVHMTLRQLGLDVLRLLNARLRSEVALRDPRRAPAVEGSAVH